MAQKPTQKKGKVSATFGSDWEGTLDSMINGNASDSMANKSANEGGGLLDTLVSSIPFLLTGKDPALHGPSESPNPQKPKTVPPVEPSSEPGFESFTSESDAQAGKAQSKGGLIKTLMSIFGGGG